MRLARWLAVIGTLVTVAMDKVVFHSPVQVGDLDSFYAEIQKVGRTSITVLVTVEVDHRDGRGRDIVTQAELTYVNIDKTGKPIPVPA